MVGGAVKRVCLMGGAVRVCSGRDMLVVYLVGGAVSGCFNICNDSGTQ